MKQISSKIFPFVFDHLCNQVMGKRKTTKKLDEQTTPVTENDSCKGCKNDESHINWLCCDVCKGWWHCVGASVRVADANKMKSQKIKYVLAKFKPQTQSNLQSESNSTKPQEVVKKQNDTKFGIIQNLNQSTSNDDNQSGKKINISLNSNAANSTSIGSKDNKGSIVIIDGIRNTQIFSNSSLIKKETSKFREFMSPAIIVYYLNEKK